MPDQESDEAQYFQLEAQMVGAQAMIDQLQNELSTDRYDRGRFVDYRHAAKGRKAYSPTGKRFRGRPAIAFDSAEREARERLHAYRAELRRARAELAEVNARLNAGAYRRRRPAWCGRAR